MSQKSIRGVQRREELNPRLDRRDVRPLSQRFLDLVETGEAMTLALVLSLGTMLMFPHIIELVAGLSALFFWWTMRHKFTLSFRLPMSARMPDHNDPKPGFNTPSMSRGIAFLGNEIGSNRELWFNKSDMCTHILVFGSTGAGKALRDAELVLTPSGWRQMSDLVVGDQVLTPNRQVAHVTDVFIQGLQPLWRMTLDDGRQIDVTPDHLWGVAAVEHSDSWAAGREPGDVEEVVSTDELEQRLFDRQDLAPGMYWSIPLTDPIGDTVVVWEHGADELAERAERALRDAGAAFPDEWMNGSVRQREATWARVRRMGAAVGSSFRFDSPNHAALASIQRLAWSMGFWAGIEPWRGGFSLVVHTHRKWIKIQSIVPLHTEEPCRCIKISDPRGLFVTRDWMVTHNTETLISLAYNALATGSGFIYIDGKGDNSLWAKIFSVVRFLGREDDLLVINYMTGGRDVTGPQKVKPSNTLNPFISGSAAGLTEVLVGLMDEAGGDNAMWKGRAISLISAIMLALVHLRETSGLLLDVDVIRDYLLLDNIQKLSKRHDLPIHVLQAVKAYLRSLPGYQEAAPKQSETVLDQHGFLQMQFTRILGSLSDTYGYIFRTNLGEVDFFDVVLNRRILVVLLPAMEKSPDELGNLGKIIVAALKQMMATGLGDVLEGDYADVIETKPTASPSPYMCILDEYGYYVVKGASVMPAQARSLGFCMVFAGQDYPAFKKNNNAEEAISTIGNCNIKIFMKLEDPTETFDLAEKSIGEGNVGKTSGLTLNQGAVNQYADQQNANIERRKRADWLDFKDHREGEAHIIFKSTLVRANMFFAAPKEVKTLQLNSMLRVEPPLAPDIQELDEQLSDLSHKIIHKQNQLKDIEADTISTTPARLRMVRDVLAAHSDPQTAGMAALGAIVAMAQHNANTMSEKTKQVSLAELHDDDDDDNADPEQLHVFRDDLEREDTEGEDDQIWSQLDRSRPSDSDKDDENAILLSETAFRQGMSQVDQNLGFSPEESAKRSESVAADMRIISAYPRNPPDPMEVDEFTDFIEELDATLDPNRSDDE